MRNHVILLAAFFRITRVEALAFLTDEELDCFETEALLSRVPFVAVSEIVLVVS